MEFYYFLVVLVQFMAAAKGEAKGDVCSLAMDRPALNTEQMPTVIDAVLKADNSTYFFKDSTIFMRNDTERLMQKKWICDLFPEGPLKVTAAMSKPGLFSKGLSNKHYLLFSSNKVFLFETAGGRPQLSEGFPKELDIIVTGAIHLENLPILITNDGKIGFYNEWWHIFSPVEPKGINGFLRTMPPDVVGGYGNNGHYKLFTRTETFDWNRRDDKRSQIKKYSH